MPKDSEDSNPKNDKEVVFGEYARYYDLLYRDKNYSGEADYITKLIHRFDPKTETILELGSGTGIHASLLTEKGFSVHGIERSPEMLSRARSMVQDHVRTGPLVSPRFTSGDIRTVRLSESFDAVLALFHVISYQTLNEDVTAAFETARHHLKREGVFIFDVWYGPAVLSERPVVRVKRVADDHIAVTRVAEPVLLPNENRVDVNYHVFVRDLATNAVAELKETHAMRYFFMPEIEWIADRFGFRCLHAEEWLTGKAPGCDTWGVCFVHQAT